MTLDKEHHRSEMESKDIQAKVAQLFGQWMTEAAAAGVSQQEVAPGPNERLADTATQLELFSGNGGLSATQWIERFEFSKQVGNWSVAKSWSVILAKLTGQARLWHLKCGRKLKTLDEWKAKFLEEFLPQQRMLNFVEDLASCRQEYGEDLQVFVWRSAAVAAQLGMTPDDIKGHILRGLLPEYEFLVHEMHGRTHTDISDLLKDIVKRIKCHGSPTDATKDAPYQLSLRWQATFAGCIPQKAVKGGYDASGETYYVARASHEGAMVPGRAVAMSRAAFVGYNGEEHIKRNFEVLVADCDLEWIKYDGGRLPSGAIQGGITEKGEPLYIGRACHEDSLTNGKVQSLEEFQKCLIPCGGQEWTYEDFEVLTCKTLSFA